MFCEIMLSAALFAVGQARPLPAIPLSREAVLPPDVYLVKAHAFNATSLKIDYVYVGPGDLKDKTFVAELIYCKIVGMRGQSFEVPVPDGQPGIWWIKKEKGEFVAVFGQIGPWFIEDLLKAEIGRANAYTREGSGRPPYDGVLFTPTWRGGSKRGDAEYEMAVVRAEVIEKIYHASDKDRLKVIDDYVQSHDSIKGAGALMLLLTGNKRYRVDKFPKIADYVLPFTKDESLSPRIQWEVEKWLLLNKDGWKGSPEEWQMIKRWYTGKWKERENVPWEASDEKVLVDYLEPMQGDRRANTVPEFLELAVAGLANDARTDRFKAALIQSLRGRPFMWGPAEAEKGFEFLLQTIRKDAAPSKRVAAAKLLVAFAPFSAERRRTIQSLRREKLGEAVAKEVEKALAEK